MALPPFNDEGDLPPGVYRATVRQIVGRFGKGSADRRRLARRLKQLYQLAKSTGQLARFVVYGSFVTAKAAPRDLDIVLVMDDLFDLSEVTGEAAILFRHQEADAHFGASVFWARRTSAFGGEQAMIEYWQLRREGGLRGIVEIVEEPT